MKQLILAFVIFICTINSYAQLIDGPNQWTKSLSDVGPIHEIAVNTINQNIVYAVSNTTGVYKTTNAGLNWSAMNNGLLNVTLTTISICASNPDVIMVGTTSTGSNPGVYKTTDGGQNWSRFVNGIYDQLNIFQVLMHPSNPNVAWVVVCPSSSSSNSTVGLFKTTDGGISWFASNTGFGDNKNTISIAINPLNPDVLFCGTSWRYYSGMQWGPCYIYKSDNGGATWVAMMNGLPQSAINPVRTISVSSLDPSVVIAGLYWNENPAGVYVSTNGGQSWMQRNSELPSNGTRIRGLTIRPGSSSEFYVGMDLSYGFFRTTDAGLTWNSFNDGVLLTSYTVRRLAFKTTGDTTLYVSGASSSSAGQGVFEYSWPTTTGIKNNSKTPEKFSLSQNYPNPFNPSTVISYELAVNSFVTLKIYDILGKEAATLVNEVKQPGSYDVRFDAGSLSSGTYFYKLITNNFVETKRMLLVK